MTNSQLRSMKTYVCCILLMLQLNLYDTKSQRFECRNLDHETDWLTSEGTINFDINSDANALFTNSSCYTNETCFICQSISFMACIGSNVKVLPNPEIVPDHLDKFQLLNSEVIYIKQGAFSNKTIREIDFENNVLSSFSQKAFEKVHGLKIISLANNNIPYLLKDTFYDLLELETLILDDNGFEMAISGDYINRKFYSVFDKTSRSLLPSNELALETLSLEKNPLRILPKSAFTWLAKSPLKRLSLRRCSVETAHTDALLPIASTLLDLELGDVSNVGPSLYNVTFGLRDGILARLGLSSSGLVAIPYTALENVAQSLTGLSLHGNTFQRLKAQAFPTMYKLETLDLRRCSIMILEDNVFNGLMSLKTLLLSGNRLANLYVPFSGLKNLRRLDLSNNPDQELSETEEFFTLKPDTFSGLQQLRSLNLANSRITHLQGGIFLPLTNLRNLSLCNTIVRDSLIKCPLVQIFKNLTKLVVLDLSASSKLIPHRHFFTNNFFGGLLQLKELYLSNCDLGDTLKDRYLFNQLWNLNILDMSSNGIRDISPKSFSSLQSLTSINLQGNLLISWNEQMFYNNTNLSSIILGNNKLSFMTNTMREELSNVTFISLRENPFICDCTLQQFVINLLNTSTEMSTEIKENSEAYKCYVLETKTYVDFLTLPDTDVCEHNISVQSSSFPVIIGTVSIMTFFLIILVVVYKKRNNLRYLAISIKNAMTVALMEDVEGSDEEAIYNYDVFVSYCEADRDWVIEQLLPALERDAQLRVCLHERDFQPGYGILDNIIHCIDKSRTLLIIVSKSALKSQWCQFEMHLAQHRFLETKREQLILILLTQIPKSQRPRTLHYLMATRTYLNWDPEQASLFWKRLKRVLSWDTSTQKTSVA